MVILAAILVAILMWLFMFGGFYLLGLRIDKREADRELKRQMMKELAFDENNPEDVIREMMDELSRIIR